MAAPAQVRAVLGSAMAFCTATRGATSCVIIRHVDRDLAPLAMLRRALDAGSGRGGLQVAAGGTLFCWLPPNGRTVPGMRAGLGRCSSGGRVIQVLAPQAVGASIG